MRNHHLPTTLTISFFVFSLLLFATHLTPASALSMPNSLTAFSNNVLGAESSTAQHEAFAELERRRGGGGHSGSGGKGGSSGGSSSGSGSGSSSGSGSGSGSSSGTGKGGSSGSSGSSGGSSTSSSTGGRSGTGSGVRPSYGGTGSSGGYYSGGARVPYSSGLRSPSGIAPYLLIGGGLGFWASTHSAWGPYGAYVYRYPGNVTYYNQTSGMNVTVPAVCLCGRYVECSCDANVNGTYVQSLVGDGSYATMRNQSGTVQVDQVNGTRTLVVNGTLANGTTAAEETTSGGERGAKIVGWGLLVAAVVGGVLVV